MQEELKSIGEVRAMLESTEKGEVRKTVGNYRLILMNDPNLQGAFRLNSLRIKSTLQGIWDGIVKATA